MTHVHIEEKWVQTTFFVVDLSACQGDTRKKRGLSSFS